MNAKEPGDDRLAYHVGRLNLSGLTMTRVILWLVAITIVSFAIGCGILALSGGFPPVSSSGAAPFESTVLLSSNTTSFPLEGASSGEIRIMLGAGKLTLRGGARDSLLIDATVFSERSTMQPVYTAHLNNSVMSVAMTATGHRKKEGIIAGPPEGWAGTWDVRISDTVPVAVIADIGAGDCTIELGTTNLTALTVNTGLGDTRVDLTGYHGGRFDGLIHNGIGDLTILVPKESNTRILMHHGVGDITTRGIVQTDEHYTTAGFNPARPVNELVVSQGVGSIQLEAV